MSGRQFQRQLMLFLGAMSVVGVGLMSLSFVALLRLSDAEWRGFLGILAVVGPAMFVGTSLLNRPLYMPVSRHLDAVPEGRGGQAELRDAFRALSALPYRFFVNGVCWWSASGIGVALVMAWRFQAFGAFRGAALALSAMAGGFVCSVFVFFGLKRRFEGLRRDLCAQLPDPEERRALVHRVDLARKLRWSVTGVIVAMVAFSLFLSLVHVSTPLESNAVEIQARFLDARLALLREDPTAIEGVREEARILGIASEIALVDPGSGEVIDGDPDCLIPEEWAALGPEPGRSTAFESPNVFAWRSLHPGGPVLVAVQPWEAIRPSTKNTWLRFGLALLLASAIAVCLAHELAREIAATTGELSERAARLSQGDLRPAEGFESEDELGELSRSFERMAASLRDTVARVSGTADRVEGTASETASVAEGVAEAARSQSEGVVETVRAVENLTAQVSDISGSAQALNLLVEDASSSIMELGASCEQLADTANTLFAKVDEVSSAIQQGAQSMREVSRNAGSLAEAAENTSTSSAQMAEQMREVDLAAEDSAARSRQVVETAERGRETVRKSVQSMEAIQRATDSVGEVIRGLGSRAEEIGSIVDVIGDVADETNLLALNAAIIAAQAGENGRAFSVVAEEIKELADRVLSSTKEVGDLIRAVQAESGNAAAAMQTGIDSVAEGVRLTGEADASLQEITRVSRESGERIDRIRDAVKQQARASSYVVGQMESVKGGVDAIQRATAEQDRGNESVVRSTEAMREIAQQLQATTAEQARGTRRLRESIEGVRSATESIGGALQVQGQSAQSVSGFLEELAGRGESNERSAKRMQGVARDLLAQAEGLRRDVERFRL